MESSQFTGPRLHDGVSPTLMLVDWIPPGLLLVLRQPTLLVLL